MVRPGSCLARRQVLAATGAGAGLLALAACTEDRNAVDSPQPGVVLLSVNELEVGQAKVVTTSDGVEVAVVREGEQEVRAFSAICTHQGCTVRAEEEDLHCPCHGSTFALTDGSVISGPAEEPLPEFPVEIQDGNVVTQ
ncbi:ubiquinol-cytochrome c reductase iron-sulfur subunit [Ruania albidiflava]|uniref:QcrA and Rieske domain-containing protein n=1 Tax=Ruania albidiflava TaxID=366586 RepID=UPI0023F35BB6|nr:Rieske (2Fe-2S) protein [Ruania albidiflava]